MDRKAPLTTKGRQSMVSPDKFPIRLPAINSHFSGTANLSESVERLQELSGFHRQLMFVLSGSILAIAEFETKIEIAHQLYLHSEIADMLRKRLLELRVSESHLERLADLPLKTTRELLHAPCTGSLLDGYREILGFLLKEYASYLDRGDPVLDRPTFRLLNRFLPELEQAAQWIEQACIAYLDTAYTETKFGSHVRALLAGDEKVALLQERSPMFTRGVACARDGRFSLFHHTREYREGVVEPRSDNERYAADRLELVRVQRDEIDAIETFANVLFDLEGASFEVLATLARFIEDEARHAEAGHIGLNELGLEPFSVPCSVIGINVRAPMPPELAFAQINLFGELNIVSRLRRLAQEARRRGDERFARMFDFIHADEVSHLRRGRELLKLFAKDGDIDQIEDDARRMAARRLSEEGVVGENYALQMTRDELFALMGE